MKVHELIAELQNYPMDMEVYYMAETSSWNYDVNSGSYGVIDWEEGPVMRVERIGDGSRLLTS
jgi:hypothetical protein